MTINFNDQYMIPALIAPRMVFTADTSAGSFVLKHITSEIAKTL